MLMVSPPIESDDLMMCHDEDDEDVFNVDLLDKQDMLVDQPSLSEGNK